MHAPVRAHHRLGLMAGLVAALALAPVALAAPPETTIVIDIEFGVSETFTATGGVVCDSGTAVTDPVFIAGFGRQERGVGTFHLVKTLTCDDGSGWFQLLVNAAGTRTSDGTVGGFSVVGGSEAYASLRGGGQILGTFTGTGIIDVYTGYLRD
jgi:hypothetical protein